MSGNKREDGYGAGLIGDMRYKDEASWHEQFPKLTMALGKPFMLVIEGKIGIRDSATGVGVSARDAVAFNEAIQLESAIGTEKYQMSDMEAANDNHLVSTSVVTNKEKQVGFIATKRLAANKAARPATHIFAITDSFSASAGSYR